MLQNDATPEALTGTGVLILRSGIKKSVTWEVSHLGEMVFGAGRVCGDHAHLETATQDRCATLQLDNTMTLAIAIDRSGPGEAFFTTLLASSVISIFHAQTICGSTPILDGSKFSIKFSDQNTASLLVILPTLIMRDYLPILENSVCRPLPGSAKTGFFRVPKTWRTGISNSYPFVLLLFDSDEPVAVSSQDARELAAELISWAEQIENRSYRTQ